MHSNDYCKIRTACEADPSKWSILLEQILAPSMRLHHYRDLSRRIVEDTIVEKDCGSCQ
jgi:hypothetical protein